MDQLETFRADFARAEAAWMRWRQIPANHCEGMDSPHVSAGPLLLAQMLQAMAAYRAYAEAETRTKIDNAASNGIPLVALNPNDADLELYIPPFLRRQPW